MVMVHTHEGTSSGKESIKVGSTGRISTLMTHELDSMKPESSKRRSQIGPVSVYCGASTKRLPPARASSAYRTSAAGSISNTKCRKPGNIHKKLGNDIPMLTAEDISIDTTPSRVTPTMRGSCIVEIVDLKCGNSRGMVPAPITNRLKKLSFSRLSDPSGK